MKYIVLAMKGGRTARAFSDREMHSDVAEESGARVISAGFVGIDADGRPYAYGRSESLDLDSMPQYDTPLLRSMWPRPERGVGRGRL